MGGNSSRRKQPTAPFPQIPQYPTPLPLLPPMRPPSPMPMAIGGPPTLNRKQQRQYEEAQRTIQNLQNQLQQARATGPMPYAGPPIVNAQGPNSGRYSPSVPYRGSPPPQYPPPSPLIQRLSNVPPYPVPPSPFGPGGYRDSDYASVANISGLNPADIALLHREYLNLTRGGATKLDRVVFRQLLREALVEANNENIDRAIENIFVAIDRNRDGFIDFSEFVGAFRDVLKSGHNDPQSFLAQYGFPDVINSSACSQPCGSTSFTPCNSYSSQPQLVSIAPPCNTQQAPLIYGNASPLVISLDAANQSPYIVNAQGQSLSAQPTAVQCVPLPIV